MLYICRILSESIFFSSKPLFVLTKLSIAAATFYFFFFSWHSKTYLTIENLQQQSTNNNIIYYLFQKLLVCPTKYEREQFPCNEGVHSNTIQIISGNNNFTIKCNCSLGACMGSVITMEIVLYNSFIKKNNNNKKHLLSS